MNYVPIPAKVRKNIYTTAETTELIRLYKQGLMIEDIAKELGRTYLSVYNKLYKLGWEVRGRTREPRKT